MTGEFNFLVSIRLPPWHGDAWNLDAVGLLLRRRLCEVTPESAVFPVEGLDLVYLPQDSAVIRQVLSVTEPGKGLPVALRCGHCGDLLTAEQAWSHKCAQKPAIKALTSKPWEGDLFCPSCGSLAKSERGRGAVPCADSWHDADKLSERITSRFAVPPVPPDHDEPCWLCRKGPRWCAICFECEQKLRRLRDSERGDLSILPVPAAVVEKSRELSAPFVLTERDKTMARIEADDIAERNSSQVIWETGRLLLSRFPSPLKTDPFLKGNPPKSARESLTHFLIFPLSIPQQVVLSVGWLVMAGVLAWKLLKP